MSSTVEKYSGKATRVTARPEQIVQADPAQLARIGKLVRGVKVG